MRCAPFAALLLVASAFGLHFPVAAQPKSLQVARSAAVRMAFYPVNTKKAASPVKTALKKRSGAQTVSIEYVAPSDPSNVASIDAGEVAGDGRRTVELSADERLARLSGELRGGREGSLAAAIWTSDLPSLGVIAKEQSTAKGDFPGPCPVIFSGDAADAEAAVAAGATGVVLSASDLEQGKALGVEIIWAVSSETEVEAIVADDAAPEDAFLLSGPDPTTLKAAIPSAAVAVAAVDAMQADDAEVQAGRDLVGAGCKALLVRGACVGDSEDVIYSKFAIKELTSKRSSTFAIDGHTGSTNGHFGGARSSYASPKDGWIRVRQ